MNNQNFKYSELTPNEERILDSIEKYFSKFDEMFKHMNDVFDNINAAVSDEEKEKSKRYKVVDKPVETPKPVEKKKLSDYLIKATNKSNLDPWPAAKILCKIGERYPSVILSIALKEISLEMDKKYDGHIKDCPIVYAYSTINGQPVTINTKDVLSFKNFAAFRTLDDLAEALSICESVLKRCFND